MAQRRIVLEGREQIAVAVAQGEDVGRVIIAPRVDEILEIAREDGCVPTFGLREARCFSVLMTYENLPVVRIQSRSLIIDVACGFVVAIDLGDVVVAVGHFAHEATIHVVEIKVHIAVAVAGQQQRRLSHLHLFHHLFFDIFFAFFLDDELRQ